MAERANRYAGLFVLVRCRRADYERHWIEAARRLLVGADRTGFFSSAFQFWWTMWRKGQDLFVHEQLIIEATLLEPFDPSDPYRQIGERVQSKRLNPHRLD